MKYYGMLANGAGIEFDAKNVKEAHERMLYLIEQYHTTFDFMPNVVYLIAQSDKAPNMHIYTEGYKMYLDVYDKDENILYAGMQIAAGSIKHAVSNNYCAGHTLTRIHDEYRMVMGKVAGQHDVEIIQKALSACTYGFHDYVQLACTGIMDGMKERATIDACYSMGYKRISAYTYSLRSASQHEISTEYVVDANMQIISMSALTASIVKKGQNTVSMQDNAILGSSEVLHLVNRIHDVYVKCNTTQRRIINVLRANLNIDLTYEQIAHKLSLDKTTIRDNIMKIRAMFNDVIPESTTIHINHYDVLESERKRKEREIKKYENQKKTQAERARRYRENKKKIQEMKIHGALTHVSGYVDKQEKAIVQSESIKSNVGTFDKEIIFHK